MLIHTGADKNLDKHVAEVTRAVFSNQGSHFTSLLSSPVFKGMSTLVSPLPPSPPHLKKPALTSTLCVSNNICHGSVAILHAVSCHSRLPYTLAKTIFSTSTQQDFLFYSPTLYLSLSVFLNTQDRLTTTSFVAYL